MHALLDNALDLLRHEPVFHQFMCWSMIAIAVASFGFLVFGAPADYGRYSPAVKKPAASTAKNSPARGRSPQRGRSPARRAADAPAASAAAAGSPAASAKEMVAEATEAGSRAVATFGPCISARTAWILMESPSLYIGLISFLVHADWERCVAVRANQVMMALFLGHYGVRQF